ncbi:hypothetical protein CapIbe_005291 [Capra ibex]
MAWKESQILSHGVHRVPPAAPPDHLPDDSHWAPEVLGGLGGGPAGICRLGGLVRPQRVQRKEGLPPAAPHLSAALAASQWPEPRASAATLRRPGS